MAVHQLITLVTMVLAVSSEVIISAATRNQVTKLNNEVAQLHIQIIAQCPDHETKVKRESVLETQLDILAQYKQYLIGELNKCRRFHVRTTPKPTTLPPTTTISAALSHCMTATNLKQPWRKDGNNGQPKIDNYNGHACDLSSKLQWFRFTGAAGSRMLNRCPTTSCGSYFPYWTEDPMPRMVGVEKTISAYTHDPHELNAYFCQKTQRVDLKVIRCSRSDYIYKYIGPYKDYCFHTFCGM
ncbi:oncoprotein-induced transcript 3 protein-like [Watersipora subatra]|uniref:oncoprotein-induced transcript 3 protein-like n=1 Tax=Watersipora subatra TaxID=2589382 RepID=UPI00355AD6D9